MTSLTRLVPNSNIFWIELVQLFYKLVSSNKMSSNINPTFGGPDILPTPGSLGLHQLGLQAGQSDL